MFGESLLSVPIAVLVIFKRLIAAWNYLNELAAGEWSSISAS